ncbi:hypothetical protein [Leyella stercorea]|uniref:hypothetical protein n=1 Tax=Leyella stercorea TaxID=363265 RepID=UPI002049EB4C|nr:hypothetical protein [Leyella stercorea]DAG84540.1 MAG TPA: hypothetical protein [Caudoviricetes sp.]
MNNKSIYGLMNNTQNGNIVQQFQQFVRQMQGKNPTEEINRLLQSGKVSQQQLNQAQQMAEQMKSMFGMFGKR